jgi:hypothetical protein
MEKRETDVGGFIWVPRAFLVMAALWLVVQSHLGSFLGQWDESHLAGNICWLLIFYCLARTLLDWGLTSLRLHRISTDALFLFAVVLGLEVAWRALVGPMDMAGTAGFITFLLQPFAVVAGMASLHHRAFSYR